MSPLGVGRMEGDTDAVGYTLPEDREGRGGGSRGCAEVRAGRADATSSSSRGAVGGPFGAMCRSVLRMYLCYVYVYIIKNQEGESPRCQLKTCVNQATAGIYTSTQDRYRAGPIVLPC